jgi:hypothetical protein
VEADVAEALDDDALALEAAVEAGLGDVLLVTEELAQRVLDAAARRLDAAAMPPALSGLPVTQAEALMSVVFIRRYWSTIQAISRSEVPMSGAGTFWEGWTRSRLASS